MYNNDNMDNEITAILLFSYLLSTKRSVKPFPQNKHTSTTATTMQADHNFDTNT